MTISNSHNRRHPLRYTCANFSECGASSSHDPSYVGWPWVYRDYRWYCSERCASKALLRRVADRL